MILGGGVPPGYQILTLFQTKKRHFSHPFSDLASRKLCHHYLDWNTNENDLLIRTFLFLSYPFGIKRINTFILSRSSLENHIRFHTKMGKVSTHFQTKTAQKPYPLGRHIPYMAYTREKPPPPHPRPMLSLKAPFSEDQARCFEVCPQQLDECLLSSSCRSED